MRVSAGIFKGRSIQLPSNSKITRATADKVRQAIFNILGDLIIDAKVLDLFSGSGLLGIEALSRGAKEVVFNDLNTSQLIKENLLILKVDAVVSSYDYRAKLRQLAKKEESFDIIFLDPPYAFADYSKLIETILDSNLLSQNGTIILEIDKRRLFTQDNLFMKVYNYNNTSIVIIRRQL